MQRIDLSASSTNQKSPSEEHIQKYVSGYATTHGVELFAEVHAMMSTGREDQLSEGLRTYYKNAMATADPEPMFKRK